MATQTAPSVDDGSWVENEPWPDEAPWPSEVDDGGWSGGNPGGGRGRGGGGGRSGPAPASGRQGRDGGRSRSVGYLAEAPALEVLRHAVHNLTEVATWLHPDLFRHPAHLGVLVALAASPTAAEAIASADDPEVADLLARLVVDEPSSEPFDAVRRLLTEVARGELTGLRLGAATLDDPTPTLADSAFLGHCIAELRTPDASVAAGERLLAWLGQRAGDGGFD